MDGEFSVKKNVFMGVCVCISAAVTLGVNLNAIFYLLVFKRGSFSRQSYNNLLMGLQAIMGACLSLLGYTWTAAALLTGSWPAANAGCSASTFCLLFFGTMDVLITLLMSVERLVALRFPYRYKELISYKTIVLALTYLFVHGAVLSGLPVFLNTVELTKEPVAMCLYSIASSSVKEKVVVHAFVVNFTVCLLVMLSCNAFVLSALRRMQGSVSATRHLQDNRDRESVIFSKMTGLMACAYLLCWLPVVVRVLVIYYAEWRNLYFDIFVFSLSSADPFVHPVTCLLMSNRYRKGYRVTMYKILHAFRKTCFGTIATPRVDPIHVQSTTQNVSLASRQ